MLIQTNKNYGADQFLNALNDSNLIFYASDLLEDMGFSDLSELDESLNRTHKIFNSTHTPEEENIKMIFRDDHGQIFCDWKVSKLAHYLLMINGTPINPKVGQNQLNVYRRFNG